MTVRYRVPGAILTEREHAVPLERPLRCSSAELKMDGDGGRLFRVSNPALPATQRDQSLEWDPSRKWSKQDAS